MAYIFIVNYSVLFGLFNFGLGLDLGFKVLASGSSIWPRLTSLIKFAGKSDVAKIVHSH